MHRTRGEIALIKRLVLSRGSEGQEPGRAGLPHSWYVADGEPSHGLPLWPRRSKPEVPLGQNRTWPDGALFVIPAVWVRVV